MRLICPRCDSQYDVDDALIPAEGRDLQCSSCGHAWFFRPAGLLPPEVEEPDPAASDARPVEEPSRHDTSGEDPEDHAEAETAPEEDQPQDRDASEDAGSSGDTDHDEGASEPDKPEKTGAETDPYAPGSFEATLRATIAAEARAAEARGTSRRPRLDPRVSEVLREEAEFETARRSKAPEPIETQPDLGLPEPEPTTPRDQEMRARMARLRGQDPEAPVPNEEPEATGTRRDLLPDIEEINSTLRATTERKRQATAPPPETEFTRFKRRRRGFRLGFIAMIAVAVAMAFAYFHADTLIAQFPDYEPWIRSYVDMANTARLRVDGALKTLIAYISDISSGDTSV